MTPRPHGTGERQRSVDEGRGRVLEAAREVLQTGAIGAFSLEAVAKRAGVTRMTVYNQFGSKGGLLEELFDVLVTRGAFSEMPAVFAQKDVGSAFDAIVAVFGRFYTENRPTMARMRAAAGSDPDLDAAIQTRNDRRRRVVETLVQRLEPRHKPSVPDAELVTTLDMLMGFNSFDALAGPTRTPADVVPLVRRLVRGVLGLPTTRRKPSRKTGRKT
jgi:AcrR family transcriptional regulator